MKTILITLALSLSLLAVGAAQKDADVQRLEVRGRQGRSSGADKLSALPAKICATPEGVKRHSSMWAMDCPKDFSKWVAAFGTLP